MSEMHHTCPVVMLMFRMCH